MSSFHEPGRHEQALALIDRIYAGAGGDDTAWQGFVEALSVAMGDAAVALSLNAPHRLGKYRVHIDPNTSGEMTRHLMGRGLPWYESIDFTEMHEHFLRVSDSYPVEELRQTQFYLDYMKPQALAADGPVVHLISSQDGPFASGLVVFRREGGRAFSNADLGMLDLLVPHLRRGLDIYSSVRGGERTTVALNEVIDRMPIGVLLLDCSRQPVMMNHMARELLGTNDGFRITSEGPRAATVHDNARLDTLLRSCIEPAPGMTLIGGGPMAIERPSGQRAFTLMILPLMRVATEASPGDPACVVFVSDPEWRQSSPIEMLKTLYGLTRAEAELVQLLMEGRSLEEAASIRGVKMNTARSQLKQVFAKTETGRQGELLQLLMTGVGAVLDPETSPASSEAD